MKRVLGTFATTLLLASALSSCGQSADDKASDSGAKACKMYQRQMKEDPKAITSMFVLPDIKKMLSRLDDPTRRAFAALITADEAWMSDINAPDEAAAKVRTVCLSEHSIEIPSP